MLRLTETLNSLSAQHDHDESLDLSTSICQYIRKLLNTRQGSVLINPNLGMPAFDLSQGLQDDADKQHFLNHIIKQIKQAEPRVADVNSQLKNDNNIAVVMAFKLVVKTIGKQTITMIGRLQSDSTFDVELA